MKLIVGLGNVGQEYVETRHNVGFLVVEQLATQHGVRLSHRVVEHRRGVARYGDWVTKGTVVRLLLPQTMMNASGEALTRLAEWRVALDDVLVVFDEVNLPLGLLRLRQGGSAGGHKGLASCLAALKTPRVARLRIGIGVQPLPRDLTDFVLSAFRREEHPMMRTALTRAVEACEAWASAGIHVAMNRVNPHPKALRSDP